MKLFAIWIIILVCTLQLLGQTNLPTEYFIDQTCGNDNNPGTSSTKPWKTLNKLSTVTLLPNTTIYLQSGVWRESLNIKASGTKDLPITVTSHSCSCQEDVKAIIDGSKIIDKWIVHFNNIYKAVTSTKSIPRQVFFSDTRGTYTTLSQLNAENEWYWSSDTLYVYSSQYPSDISAAVVERPIGITITGSYVTVKNLQIQKTYDEAVSIGASTVGVIIENCDITQWSNQEVISPIKAGIMVLGNSAIVRKCTLGKSADQNYSGFISIYVSGSNAEVYENTVVHSSLELAPAGNNIAYLAHGIVVGAGNTRIIGTTRIHNNNISHVGGSGISIGGRFDRGDTVAVYDNTISECGQAGVSCYQTRAYTAGNSGGTGLVYNNDVSYSNRLGGTQGSNGNRASNIHFNNGRVTTVDATRPYIKWYCYKNHCYRASTPTETPNTPDSDGIAVDFNANGVEVFNNIIHDNDGKGIYLYNASKCKIYYNLIYQNAAGIVVSAEGGIEKSVDNEFYNNTCYLNRNANNHANINFVKSEIFFGFKSVGSIIKNNIFFAGAGYYAMRYDSTGTSKNVCDNNLIYSEAGLTNNLCYFYGRPGTLASWRNSLGFDRNSIAAYPYKLNPFVTVTTRSSTAGVDKGVVISGLNSDILGNSISNAPDLGCYEYIK